MLGARCRWKMDGGVADRLLIALGDGSAGGKLQTARWQGLKTKEGAIMNQEKAYNRVNQRDKRDCKCNIVHDLRWYTYGVVNQEDETGAAMNRARPP
jgi:hypothetical protein